MFNRLPVVNCVGRTCVISMQFTASSVEIVTAETMTIFTESTREYVVECGMPDVLTSA